MLKQLIQCSLLAALLGLCSLAAADMELVEEAAEFERLTTRVTADGDGYINLRACDTCESQQLRLTEATRVFINGKGHHVTELNRG
ncbi:MAG: hypothetical protein KJO55_02035, partial [Gammaproteobacteria bacterium]|nr:hypothetical protein [Gammaproteobacteria bacterium]